MSKPVDIMSKVCYYETRLILTLSVIKHLIPPILTYVRLCATCFISIYPPLLRHLKRCMHTNPFNQRIFTLSVRWVTFARMGGLKGKTAPGDAHPYLALFYIVVKIKLVKNVQVWDGGL